MAEYHHSTDLPWVRTPEELKRSRNITQTVLAIFLVAGVIMPMLQVPEIDRNQARELPPRLAKLIMEKQQPKPVEPVPEPKVEKKEEKKPEKKQEVKKEKKKEPEKKQEPEIDVAAKAREKASRSGLLALADELDDLRDTPAVPQVNLNLSRNKTAEVPEPEPEMLTMKRPSSGGIDRSKLTRATRPVRDLSGRNTEKLDSPIVKAADEGRPVSRQRLKGPRTLEQIQRVIERYKGALTRIHSIALRRDPTIEGDVVLEIGIAAAGNVTSCRAISSTFNAPSFIGKVETKCKSFDFGPATQDMKINYPLNFAPVS